MKYWTQNHRCIIELQWNNELLSNCMCDFCNGLIYIPDFPTPPSPSITILYTRRPPRVVFDGCAIFDKSLLFSLLPALSSFLFLLFFRDTHPIDSPAIIKTYNIYKNLQIVWRPFFIVVYFADKVLGICTIMVLDFSFFLSMLCSLVCKFNQWITNVPAVVDMLWKVRDNYAHLGATTILINSLQNCTHLMARNLTHIINLVERNEWERDWKRVRV